MIKKIIFDLDNTLIEWKDEYISALINTLKKLNINYSIDKIKQIDLAITEYENYNNTCSENNFLEFINKRCNIDLPIEFVNILLEEQTNCFEQFGDSEIDILEYLSNKYELIILSNWFTYTQEKRLEKAGILKYFSFVSGGDKHILKPSIEAFNMIDNPRECVMIGDNIKNDIEPAIELGMQAILITNKNVRKDLRYRKIRKLEELKEML